MVLPEIFISGRISSALQLHLKIFPHPVAFALATILLFFCQFSLKMNAAQGVLSKVMDLKQLQVIPGITKEKTSENTQKLLTLAEAIASGDPSAAILNDLDFTPCYQISRDHLWHWGDEVIPHDFKGQGGIKSAS